MADSAVGLYLHLCRLPKKEQIKFLNWARDYINKLEQEQENERTRKCEVMTSTETVVTSKNQT